MAQPLSRSSQFRSTQPGSAGRGQSEQPGTCRVQCEMKMRALVQKAGKRLPSSLPQPATAGFCCLLFNVRVPETWVTHLLSPDPRRPGAPPCDSGLQSTPDPSLPCTHARVPMGQKVAAVPDGAGSGEDTSTSTLGWGAGSRQKPLQRRQGG